MVIAVLEKPAKSKEKQPTMLDLIYQTHKREFIRCPRCIGGKLVLSHGELNCPNCGYSREP
jgi:uncharacterized Zn finger protein (UPF0148 family)